MKILLISSRYFVSGGPERYLFNIEGLLKNNGHEVVPFSTKSALNRKTVYEKDFANSMGGQDLQYYKQYRKTPKMIFDIVSRLFYSFHVRRRLKKVIKKEKPEVAYILQFYNKLSPSIIDACKMYNIPVYIRLSDYFLICPESHMLDNDYNICEQCNLDLYNVVKKKCIKNSFIGSLLKYFAYILQMKILKIYNKVDGFICTTEFMKEKMIKAGYEKAKMHVIPTLIDSKIDNMKIKKTDDDYILYFGRTSKEKGVDILISAYILSCLWEKNIKLKIIGGISEIPNSKNSEIINNIEFYDFMEQEDLNNYIYNSIVMIHPAIWYENLPNSILEAYKYSKPVIASNIGSLPETVIDGVTGVLFEKGNIEDLSSKLNSLVNDVEKLKYFKLNIDEEIKKYAPSLHLKKLLEVFNGKKYK